MPKVCGLAVERLRIAFGKVGGFCATSTNKPEYLTGQVFFIHKLNTTLEQVFRNYSQAIFRIIPSYANSFYTFSTAPINTTNLIKG